MFSKIFKKPAYIDPRLLTSTSQTDLINLREIEVSRVAIYTSSNSFRTSEVTYEPEYKCIF